MKEKKTIVFFSNFLWYYFCVNDDGCRILFSGVSGIMVNIKDIEEKNEEMLSKSKKMN